MRIQAARESKKGEDACAAICEGDDAPAAFAIFDGHSGKISAKECAEIIPRRILDSGTPFDPKVVVDTFWAVDEELGKKKIFDGATAQLLLVDKAADGGLDCMLAWCGDSSAVHADVA